MSLAPEIKIAEQRLSVLELAKALGNVSAACKQRGVSRSRIGSRRVSYCDCSKFRKEVHHGVASKRREYGHK